MDFDLPSNRSRTTVPVPPGMALAVATIVAAGVTGLAVAGLAWTFDRPSEHRTSVPPDLALERTPEPSAAGPMDTPGWAEALGLPAPAPTTSGPAPVEAVAAPTAAPVQEETVRRTAAARRPVAGPTGPVRSAPTAAAAAPVAPATGAASTGPDLTDGATPDPTATDVIDPTTAPATDPAAGLDADPGADTDTDLEPTATETTAPRRRWEQPRRTWRDEPQPAPAPQWGGPFGDFPRMFPWG